VEAARKASVGWASATAYNRGQVMYRMAEMMEGKRVEFVEAIESTRARGRGGAKGTRGHAAKEVEAAIDRLVCFAGWADKYAQVLGCNNPVAGPYYNFTVPEATGVVAVIAPDEHPLLGLISLMAPVMCSGNTVVAIGSEANPIPAAILGEVIATSDVPGGVVNILTGERKELLAFVATHRDIDAVHACVGSVEEAKILREGVAENLKRVVIRQDVDWFDVETCHSPWWIEPFVEMKTIWHPAAT
jgi:acyl-CoA reductase-like NAD-dependent aldehyde dehydrogenase